MRNYGAISHEGLVAMVEDHGKVATGQVLAEWLATDGDDEEIAPRSKRAGLRRGRQLRRKEPMQRPRAGPATADGICKHRWLCQSRR